MCVCVWHHSWNEPSSNFLFVNRQAVSFVFFICLFVCLLLCLHACLLCWGCLPCIGLDVFGRSLLTIRKLVIGRGDVLCAKGVLFFSVLFFFFLCS